MTISFATGGNLSRTFGTPTDPRKFRIEIPLRRGSLPAAGAVIMGAAGNQGFIGFGGSTVGGAANTLVINFLGTAHLISNQIVAAGVDRTLAIWGDTTQAAPNVFASIDGVTVTWATANYPTVNATLGTLFSAALHTIGDLPPYAIDFLGEMGRFRYQDGDPSQGGALGANGCNLLFTSAATLGLDAGGANNWTVNGACTYTTTNIGLPRLGIVFHGQSNSTFWGGAPLYTLRNPGKIRLLDYASGGQSFPTAEPFAGVDGTGGGCYATPLLDLLYETGKYSGIDVAMPGQGGTNALQFAAGGIYYGRIAQTCNAFINAGAKIDFVLWGQGETDAQMAVTATDYCGYVQSVQSGFRASFPNVKFLTNLETWIPNVPPVANAGEIRRGQVMATDSANNLIGIDWDEGQQDAANRSGGAHMSYNGRVNVQAPRTFDRMRSLL